MNQFCHFSADISCLCFNCKSTWKEEKSIQNYAVAYLNGLLKIILDVHSGVPHSIFHFFQQESRTDVLIFIEYVYAIIQGNLNKNKNVGI